MWGYKNNKNNCTDMERLTFNWHKSDIRSVVRAVTAAARGSHKSRKANSHFNNVWPPLAVIQEMHLRQMLCTRLSKVCLRILPHSSSSAWMSSYMLVGPLRHTSEVWWGP